MTPASTVKIATAAAASPPSAPNTGSAPPSSPAPDPDRSCSSAAATPPHRQEEGTGRSGGSLVALAADTARALKAAGTTSVALGHDDSLYSGPTRHPIGVNDNIAPVTALMADEGRPDDSVSGPVDRTEDPTGDTARAFAALLTERGIKVTGDPTEAKAPSGAKPLATTLSTPWAASSSGC